jgi:hypothetical protein
MTEMRKKIDANLAGYLMDAADHMARLELEMRDMRWRLCFRDDLSSDGSLARGHCRKLIHALEMVDHCLSAAAEDAAGKPAIRQVSP